MLHNKNPLMHCWMTVHLWLGQLISYHWIHRIRNQLQDVHTLKTCMALHSCRQVGRVIPSRLNVGLGLHYMWHGYTCTIMSVCNSKYGSEKLTTCVGLPTHSSRLACLQHLDSGVDLRGEVKKSLLQLLHLSLLGLHVCFSSTASNTNGVMILTWYPVMCNRIPHLHKSHAKIVS